MSSSTRFRGPVLAGVVAATLAASAAAGASESPGGGAEQSTPPPKVASKQENIGVVSGLAIGAAAGGPIGAIAGAAAGAWIGDRYHRQLSARKQLAEELSQSEAERQRLTARVETLDTSVKSAQAEHARLEALAAQARELSTEVSFRTGEAVLSAQNVAQLQRVAALAAALPDAHLRIAGYADPRGSRQYNLELSQARADAVAHVLLSAGLAAGQITLEAHGAEDCQSLPGDVDGYAFERRVEVHLESAGAPVVAQRE